jgi:hypothetical protein
MQIGQGKYGMQTMNQSLGLGGNAHAPASGAKA